MALIRCSECGKEISSQSSTCVNCGNPIIKQIICEECGNKINENMMTCPYCGVSRNTGNINSKSKLSVYNILFIIAIIIYCIFWIYEIFSNMEYILRCDEIDDFIYLGIFLLNPISIVISTIGIFISNLKLDENIKKIMKIGNLIIVGLLILLVFISNIDNEYLEIFDLLLNIIRYLSPNILLCILFLNQE